MRLKICVFKEWDNSDSTRFVSLKEWANSDSIFHNEKIFGRSMNLIQMGSKSCFVKKKKKEKEREKEKELNPLQSMRNGRGLIWKSTGSWQNCWFLYHYFIKQKIFLMHLPRLHTHIHMHTCLCINVYIQSHRDIHMYIYRLHHGRTPVDPKKALLKSCAGFRNLLSKQSRV